MLGRNSSLQRLVHSEHPRSRNYEKIIGPVHTGKNNWIIREPGLKKKDFPRQFKREHSEQRFSHWKSEKKTPKKVRFSPELEIFNLSKITANSIVSAVRQENSLPEIFNKKKLYAKLDVRFGLEKSNDYYIRYFLSPTSKVMNRYSLRCLDRKFSNK